MYLLLILDIARTLLLARIKQSVVAAVGVTFGIGLFISMISFMQGLNKLMDDMILNRTPHILLYNEVEASKNQPITITKDHHSDINIIRSIKPKEVSQDIHNSLAIVHSLKHDDRVVGVAPRVTAQVFYNAGELDINGVIYGIDVAEEEKMFSFSDYVVAGKAKDMEVVTNSICLGKGIAEKLLVEVGDIIHVSTAKGRRLPLKVVGIFQLGLADIDAVQSYASIQTIQNLLGKTNNYITEIQVKVFDINKSPSIAKEYKEAFDTDTRDIISSNAQYETGSNIRNIITYSVAVTLLIVAGFGIYNILNMMIYEKMDSIAIMKATGFSGKDVDRIFLSLSLIIGIAGGLTGLLFGYVGSLIIDQIPFETKTLPTLKTMPVVYKPIYYFIGITFSIVTTYFAGYFPARRASKVDPVEIIRGK